METTSYLTMTVTSKRSDTDKEIKKPADRRAETLAALYYSVRATLSAEGISFGTFEWLMARDITGADAVWLEEGHSIHTLNLNARPSNKIDWDLCRQAAAITAETASTYGDDIVAAAMALNTRQGLKEEDDD